METKEIGKETVADIVREDYRTARVFKHYGIDFCCGGGKSIEEACSAKKVSLDDLMSDLSDLAKFGQDKRMDFDSWSMDALIDHIETKHHRYVEATVPAISQYLHKLTAVHGHAAPVLREVRDVFETSKGNLAQHMKKEELILFPRIKTLVKLYDSPDLLSKLHPNDYSEVITELEIEHSTEGANFERIDTITDHFSVPEWGCNTYHVAMRMLEEFQDDLHQHIHLENNILFPKVVEMIRARIVQ